MTYNPAAPQPNHLLSRSQQDILDNFSYLDTIMAVNHVNYSDVTVANRGKHTFIELIEQGADPATAADEMALYTKDVGGASELFMRRESSGDIIQLSGNLINHGGNQYTVVTPFGVYFKFGQCAAPVAPGAAYAYPVAFATATLSVQLTKIGGSTEFTPVVSAVTNAGFTATCAGGVTVYYFAVGN